MRVRTQQKDKNNKSCSLKSRSQEVFDRLRSIYGLRGPADPSSRPAHSPSPLPLRPALPARSPRKLTPNRLRLHIPASRTPQEKSGGFLTQRGRQERQKERERQEAASARVEQGVVQGVAVEQEQGRLEELRRRVGVGAGGRVGKANETQKYFRKERERGRGELNETLRMVWELKPRRPKYEFRMIRRMGKSQAGEILLAVSNLTGCALAMKTFRKAEVKLGFFIDETKIHFYCAHPNILPAYGLHVGREEAYLMMEVGEGNLYDRIVRDAPFDERRAALYVAQVAAAVAYLHRAGVMHRDIKPENIICFGQTLKLADFGWSIFTAQPRRTLCGTVDYISPEVVNRQPYDSKIDCWSIGVLMFEMLTGQPPFPEQQKNPHFDHLALPAALSSQGRGLLQLLLHPDPASRIAAKDILDHDWIKFHLRKQAQDDARLHKKLRLELDLLLA